MQRITTLLVFISLLSTSFAQTILKEQTLTPPGKQLGAFSTFGVKSVVNGAGSNSTYNLPPTIEFANIAENGFIIRKEYTFTKYNENLEKEWEKEIDKVYGLSSLPSAIIVGKKNLGIFFVQFKRTPSRSEIHITRFDEKGNVLQTAYKVEQKYEDVLHTYVNEQGLNIITTQKSKKEGKVIYTLLTFATKNLASTVKNIPLESNEYELDHDNDFDDPQRL